MPINDPTEIIDSQIDHLGSMIDADGTCPCAECGKHYKIDDMYPASAHPAAPLLCTDCDALPGWPLN